MKGIWEKIQESKPVDITKPLDWEEIFQICEEYNKRQKDEYLRRDKNRKENMKHLTKRAKELGKEIPTEVMVIVFSGVSVGEWFIEKYKEWL